MGKSYINSHHDGSNTMDDMNATITVKGQMVYVLHTTPDYYLVSLNADGTRKFKADKIKPNTNEDKKRS